MIAIDNARRGLAMTVDATPRYVEADAYEGGKQAVAECWRNLTAVGARPLAVTDSTRRAVEAGLCAPARGFSIDAS